MTYFPKLRLLCVVVVLVVIPLAASAQFRFEEATIKTGLKATSSQPVEIGPGPVVFDFDNDGWDDIYTPGGTSADRLFRNMHDGTFQDVADSNFLNKFWTKSYSRGGTAFDYDGDGLTDLYIICERHDLLLKNMGGGVFTDVSKKAQIATPMTLNESNDATFGDFDGDGDNDLFVARWVEENKFIQQPDGGVTGYAHKGFRNYLYVNKGNGTFAEMAVAMHVDGDTGNTNIALFFDYDRDGDLDLLIGNDFGVSLTPNAVYKNMLMETGTASFVDVTDSIGLRTHIFCMGIAPNDYNRDGQFDFYETNIGKEYLMKNQGGVFVDVSSETHIPNGKNRHDQDYSTVSWTPLFSDFDNDGWEDAFIVHGFEKGLAPWITTDPDTSMFIRNLGGTFSDYTDTAMGGLLMDLRARGGALIDYDKDGYPDILYAGENMVSGIQSRDYRLFHNITTSITEKRPHMIEMRFHAKRTAAEGIGTIADVWAGGIVHSRQVSTGGGFASMNTLTQHVGLGEFDHADSINIFWPADKNRHRQIDHYYNVATNQLITFEEKTDPSSVGMIAEEPLSPERGVHIAPQDKVHIQLFPQPATSLLHVTGLSNTNAVTYTIYNVVGQQVSSGVGYGPQLEIVVSDLPLGSYQLRLKEGATVSVRSFIRD